MQNCASFVFNGVLFYVVEVELNVNQIRVQSKMIHLTAQNLTQKEVIQNVFAPLIGVICSPQAEELCYKNNLTFVELLQPYSKLTNDGEFSENVQFNV